MTVRHVTVLPMLLLALAGPAQAQPTEPVSTAPVRAEALPSSYGPVQSGESLSTIGIALSEASGIHVAQVMWALYAQNPDAFDGSINKLLPGANFVVPSADVMTSLSIGQARINIRDAVEGRSAAQSRPPEAEPPQPVVQAPPRQPVGSSKPLPEPTQPAPARPAAEQAPAPVAPTARPKPVVAATAPPTQAAAQPVEPAAELPLEEPAEAESEEAADPASSQPSRSFVPILLLVLIVLALGLLLWIVISMQKRQSRREEEQKLAQELGAQRRAELAKLAKGDYSEEDADAEPEDPAYAATQVMPAVQQDDPAFAATQVMPAAQEDDPAFAATQVMPTAAAADEEAGLDSFDDGITDGEDLSSKLDLAGGYVAMGEMEQARALLAEVIQKGDPEQVAEAQRMLDDLV
ncbi:MAG: FimV/HubP family polar landmark protein [Oceanococcaceae bacterium]